MELLGTQSSCAAELRCRLKEKWSQKIQARCTATTSIPWKKGTNFLASQEETERILVKRRIIFKRDMRHASRPSIFAKFHNIHVPKIWPKDATWLGDRMQSRPVGAVLRPPRTSSSAGPCQRKCTEPCDDLVAPASARPRHKRHWPWWRIETLLEPDRLEKNQGALEHWSKWSKWLWPWISSNHP